MTEQERQHWDRRLDICKHAEQEIQNKWLTASGVHSYLRHLPKYEDIGTTCPDEYTFVPTTIKRLYKYAEQMFGFTPTEAEEAGTHGCEPSYLLALTSNNQSFIGAICGDIIGSAYEFNKTKNVDFELFTSKSKFTDDTVMTCAVADWLKCDSQHSHSELIKTMHNYGRKYPNVSYGGYFRIWLETNQTRPYNSLGNGSAMRVSPIGFYAESLDEALQLAKTSAEVTHNHPKGIAGAQAVAAAIYIMKKAAIKNNIAEGKKEVMAFLKEKFSYRLDYTKQEWEDHVQNYVFNETCQGSVPEAIYCALSSDSYEQAIRKAVSLGGDADTQAAIAGGIAAAFCPVPLSIVSECFKLLPEELKSTMNSFNSYVIRKEMSKSSC